jgi:RNA polymerase sigma-70 factor (ECF subfamily)
VVETDEALVARGRGSADEGAFAELVRRHRDRVFRVALAILGPGFAGEAEEVAQEVFVRAHYALTGFRGQAQFGSWVYRIAFNQALNLKARVRHRAPHVSDEVLDTVEAPEPDPLARLQAERRQRALHECLYELPEVYQAALRLHYWMGASVAEIGTLIGVPENTVKSYMHRARRLLHVMLKEQGLDD